MRQKKQKALGFHIWRPVNAKLIQHRAATFKKQIFFSPTAKIFLFCFLYNNKQEKSCGFD